MALTLQAAEDALKAAQATFETASTNLNASLGRARNDGVRPFGTVMTVADAQAAYDTAKSARDVALAAKRDAELAADRPNDTWADVGRKNQGARNPITGALI